MVFDPRNPVIQRFLRGISLEEGGKPDEAQNVFLHAWEDAASDFEKYLAAYYLARHQEDDLEKLRWLKAALQYALIVDRESVQGAPAFLHRSMGECYERLGESRMAATHHDLALNFPGQVRDEGPFYHGTKADLRIGDLLLPGGGSNYQSGLVMNHIYFTALPNGAGLAAALALGQGRERVYIVTPTGLFENDPNVTDKKFPGNPTRSYRSLAPLEIVGELDDWARMREEEVAAWRQKLAANKGEIIN